MKKFSLFALAALLCAVMSTAALASQTGRAADNGSGQKIITVTNGEKPDGQRIVTVESGDEPEGQRIVTVGSEHSGQNGHKIVTVSGGDTYSVEGEGGSPRLSYEEYSFWGFSDGYEDDHSYYGGSAPVSSVSDNAEAAQSGAVVSGSQAIGYYDDGYYNDGYYDDGYYDDGYYNDGYYDYGYYDDGHVAERGGGVSGMLILIALGIGAIVALTYYFSTKSSYENAGVGVVYDLKENAVLKLGSTRDMSSGVIDRKVDTRSHIDRGFYRSGASVSGQQSGQYGNLSAPGGRPQTQGGQRPVQGGQRPMQGGNRPAGGTGSPQGGNIRPPRPPRPKA